VIVAVLAVGGMILHLLTPRETNETPRAQKKSSLLPTVTNSVRRTSKPAVSAEKRAFAEKMNKLCYETGWSNGVYRSKDPAYAEKRKAFLEEQAKIPFRFYSENVIASIVCAKPGAFLFPIPIDAQFEDDFMNSLKYAITIGQDDSEEVAEQKRAVREAKVYIKEKLDAGEPLAKIIENARNEINKISRMHDNYQNEIIKLKAKGATKEELESFVEAANKILDKEGGTHIRMPFVYKHLKE